jgi:hypothetical protein
MFKTLFGPREEAEYEQEDYGHAYFVVGSTSRVGTRAKATKNLKRNPKDIMGVSLEFLEHLVGWLGTLDTNLNTLTTQHFSTGRAFIPTKFPSVYDRRREPPWCGLSLAYPSYTQKPKSIVEAILEGTSGVPETLLKELRAPPVGQATVMLVHPWSLNFVDLVEAARKYSDDAEVYFWIDVFTVRQVCELTCSMGALTCPVGELPCPIGGMTSNLVDELS